MATSPNNLLDQSTHCSVREAADYVGCSTKTIRRWIKLGLLAATRPFNRGSSRLRVSVASLRRLLAAR